MTSHIPWIKYLWFTLLISWVLGIVLIIPLQGLENLFNWPHNSVSNIVAKYGPSLAGLLTAYLVYGFKEFVSLLKKGITWRVPWYCYLLAIALPFVSKLHLFWVLDTPLAWQGIGIEATSIILLAFLTHLFLGGGFGEEFGWRGFMLPELNKQYSWLRSSLIIGTFWVIWHLPAYVLGNQAKEEPFLPFTVAVFAFSIIMTWLYYRSSQSVLIVAIFHAMVNASGKAIAAVSSIERAQLQTNSFMWGEAGILALLAVVIVLVNKQRFFNYTPP